MVIKTLNITTEKFYIQEAIPFFTGNMLMPVLELVVHYMHFHR